MKKKMLIITILFLWNVAFYYSAYPEIIKGEADIDFQVADTVAATIFKNQRIITKYDRIETNLRTVEDEVRKKIRKNPDDGNLWEQLLDVDTLGVRTEAEKDKQLAMNWENVAQWILKAKEIKWGKSATYDYKGRLKHQIDKLKKDYNILKNPAALANQIAHLQIVMKKYIQQGTDMGPAMYDSLYVWATLQAEAYRIASLQAEQSIPLIAALIGQKRLSKVDLIMRNITSWRDLIRKMDEETKSSHWSPDSVIQRIRQED